MRLLLSLFLFLPLFLPLFLTACAGDDREALVIYSPHGKEMLSEYEQAFEEAHPDVDVQWLDMGGEQAYDRIRTEAQNPQASLWWGGASTAFARAAGENLLEPYQPTWASAVPAEAHDAQHRWYGTYLTPEVIMYNTEALDSTEVPRDWEDLLDEKWRDRILIRYPLQSHTMRTIYSAMIMRQPTVEEGYAWLARLDQNTKAYAADPTQLYLRLARGEADLTLWNLPDVHIQRDQNNYPFGAIFPASGTPVLTDGIALVKGGPSLERAKQFYEFITTEEALIRQARTYGRIPTRTDIPDESLPAWIAEADYTPMPIDWQRMEAQSASWMRYWDENIKGRGVRYLQEQQQ